MRKEKHRKRRAAQEDRELAALVQLRDEDIDTSDIPEVRDWSKAVVGSFYRPIKEPVTIRIDSDVLAWLKLGGAGLSDADQQFIEVGYGGAERGYAILCGCPRKQEGEGDVVRANPRGGLEDRRQSQAWPVNAREPRFAKNRTLSSYSRVFEAGSETMRHPQGCGLLSNYFV